MVYAIRLIPMRSWLEGQSSLQVVVGSIPTVGKTFHFVIISSFVCNTARYANTNKNNRDIHQYPAIAWKWYYLLVQYA